MNLGAVNSNANISSLKNLENLSTLAKKELSQNMKKASNSGSIFKCGSSSSNNKSMLLTEGLPFEKLTMLKDGLNKHASDARASGESASKKIIHKANKNINKQVLKAETWLNQPSVQNQLKSTGQLDKASKNIKDILNITKEINEIVAPREKVVEKSFSNHVGIKTGPARSGTRTPAHKGETVKLHELKNNSDTKKDALRHYHDRKEFSNDAAVKIQGTPERIAEEHKGVYESRKEFYKA